MHHCHYDCILRYHYKPVSPKCTSCMKTCIDKWKKAYYNVVGYDASIESAREKHKVCLWCGKFSVSHSRDCFIHCSMNKKEEHMLDTTWMMCNFPQPSPEGVQECRDKLWNEFKTVSRNCLPNLCLTLTLELSPQSVPHLASACCYCGCSLLRHPSLPLSLHFLQRATIS